ncbi:MAG TPA: hypothetical protein VEY91_04110 [Candidatus Limnocylindria bacterium]|nr:hypothetical protein [Candidatus Limnocylindria bacterium]
MRDWALAALLASILGLGWWFVTRSPAVGWGIVLTVMAGTVHPRSGRSRVEVGVLISLVWAVTHLYLRSE